MGRLTGEPELRHTSANLPVTSFTLAVGRSFSKNDETDFIDIVAWRNQAEFVSKWFHKGMLVAVSGRLQTRTWKDKEGNNRKSFEVMAEEVHFAEPKKSEGYAPSSGRPDYGPPPAIEEESGFRDLSGDDDELPF
jgi:single-strand DNA-binding protein